MHVICWIKAGGHLDDQTSLCIAYGGRCRSSGGGSAGCDISRSVDSGNPRCFGYTSRSVPEEPGPGAGVHTFTTSVTGSQGTNLVDEAARDVGPIQHVRNKVCPTTGFPYPEQRRAESPNHKSRFCSGESLGRANDSSSNITRSSCLNSAG